MDLQQPWLYKRCAAIHFQLGDNRRALADISKAVESNAADLSNLSWIPLDQAAKCPDENFRDGLLELADRSIELTDNAARAYAARGQLLTAFGQEDRALADLRTAFDQLPKDDASKELELSAACSELGNLCGELAHRKETLPYLVKMTNCSQSAEPRHLEARGVAMFWPWLRACLLS